MDNLLSIHLEAHDAANNRHRKYVAIVGRDLFGRWSLQLQYGRVGSSLRELRFSGDVGEIRRLLRDHLRRRLSAPRRIGCAYRLCALEVAPESLDREWLPAEMIAGFLAVPASQVA